MKIITFLFGAGASKEALPLISEIPDRLDHLINLLEKEENKLDSGSTFDQLKLKNPKSKEEYQIELIESLKWLQAESKRHASVDTFAKKLFVKGNYNDLEKLKIAISVFFVFEQSINKPDFRYDAFFASLLYNVGEFPENIRILSWNYDYQFELAFSEYSGQDEILANANWLRIKSKFDNNRVNPGFNIFKLNGTIGLSSDRGFRQYLFTNNLKVPLNIDLISKVTQNFVAASYLQNINSSLSFAWEVERTEKNIISQALESTKETYSLVVIGYSFPFFNRDSDRKIIGNMQNLKRVYFQAPDADNLKERFQALRDDLSGIELIPKFDVNQFLLPNEL